MIQLTCPRHNKQVHFVNIDENVEMGLRTACDACGLKTPISVQTAMEMLGEIVNQERQQALKAENKEIQILNELKNRLNALKKKAVERLDESLLFLEKSIKDLRTKFIDLNYQQPQQISLTDLQNIAYKISQRNNDRNEFQLNLKQILQERIAILIETCDQVTSIQEEFRDLRRYQPLQLIPQDLSFDSIFIPNSDYLVATNQNSINYYQCKNDQWQLIKQIRDAHKNCIESLSINEEYIVSGGMDKIVRLYNSRMEQIYSLQGHRDQIKTTAISRKYAEIFSAGYDRIIMVWKREGLLWQLDQKLNYHTGQILSISLSESEEFLVSGGWDKSVIIWERNNTWKMKQIIEKAHNEDIYSVCFISDNMFASGSRQLKTWCYNSAYGKFEQHRVLATQQNLVHRIKSQQNILVSQNENQVQIWKVNKGLELILAIEGFYVGISISEDQKFIVMYNVDKKQLEVRELK